MRLRKTSKMISISNTLVLGICIGVAVVFVAIGVLMWLRDRRGGALRSFAVACAVIGLYLTGLVDLLARAVSAVVTWARDLVLNTPVYIGIGLLVLTILLWIIGSRLITRRIRKIADGTYISPSQKKAKAQPVTAGSTSRGNENLGTTDRHTADRSTAGRSNTNDDMDDVNDILKSRGIE